MQMHEKTHENIKTVRSLKDGVIADFTAVESMIEYNAAVFKGGEAMAKKMYEYYVSNVAASFEGVKALNKTNDVADFYKVATTNMASAAERLSDQGKSMVEMSGKVMKETGEAGRLAYSKGFAISM